MSPQFSATPLAGGQFQIQAPALNPAAVGNHWEMNWGCPVGGSEIAAVQFGALRTQAASSLALLVTGNRQTLWSVGDTDIPQSPRSASAYDVRLPGGQCNVHLALAQVEARAQHARGYFIDNPARPRARPHPAGRHPARAHPRLDQRRLRHRAGAVDHDRQLRQRRGRHPARPHRRPGPVDRSARRRQPRRHTRARRDRRRDPRRGGPSRRGRHGRRLGRRDHPGRSDPAHRARPVVVVARVARHRRPRVAGRRQPERRRAQRGGGERGGGRLGVRRLDRGGSRDGDGSARDHGRRRRWPTASTHGGSGPPTVPATWRSSRGPSASSWTRPRRSSSCTRLPTNWVNRAEIDLTVTDNLQTALGLAPIEFDVNAAADGGESGPWVRALDQPRGGGPSDRQRRAGGSPRRPAPHARRRAKRRPVRGPPRRRAAGGREGRSHRPRHSERELLAHGFRAAGDRLGRRRPARRDREGERAMEERVVVADDRERGCGRRLRLHAGRRLGPPGRPPAAAPRDHRHGRQRRAPLRHGPSRRERQRDDLGRSRRALPRRPSGARGAAGPRAESRWPYDPRPSSRQRRGRDRLRAPARSARSADRRRRDPGPWAPWAAGGPRAHRPGRAVPAPGATSGGRPAPRRRARSAVASSRPGRPPTSASRSVPT